MQQFESFAQMQRDAAMRVMEMQRRAQAAMRHSPPPGLPAVAEIPADSPLSEPETEGSLPTESSLPTEEMHKPERQEISQEDTERALITAILLLLMRENADERLIFALLYILM